MLALMRTVRATLVGMLVVCGFAESARAQEPPPPIPWFAFDAHVAVPSFPNDVQAVADSRGIQQLAELPGAGIGIDLAAHIYPVRWKAVTVGLGGRLATMRAHHDGDATLGTQSVTERFTYLGPQLSLNFGSASGWSYLSAGVAGSTWSIVYDNAPLPFPQNDERLKTFDYGGGARWFAKKHLAFSFDLRFYVIAPGTPELGLPASPRTTLMVVSAGVSLK